ncbi:Sensory box sensor/GGDEF/EAL domain protein [hydrothermal vent metagenome]|uniref:Sensory box sensor/GGDEF/EAL domain protein n=1 Tax=hydrothermal vent metagenome TaxID=652676 RepID=A0A1W1BXZ5_9ZZZZ
MNTHKKLLLIVTVMLLVLMMAIVINVALNFREYSYKSALNKAQATAEYVRDGLTAHMVNGIMDKREFFLNNIKNHKDIQSFWIIRAPNVIKQFGKGFENEKMRDAIDKKVIESGKMHYTIKESSNEATLRVTIPYVATAYGSPNCLDCHNAKEGDVLGAISLKFNISETRYISLITIAKIIAINIIFLIIALLSINYFFRPILNLFNELNQMIQNADRGDYSKRITLDIQGEGKEVVEQINNLFEKLESTFKNLKTSLSTFVANAKIACQNPLEESQKIIDELSNIYKFKKTIELDRTHEDIFKRIYYILQERFYIKEYKFYLVDKEKNERELLHYCGNINKSDCTKADKDANLCRAFRTHSEVLSIDFEHVCTYCTTDKDTEYLCISFDINNEFSLIISFFTEDQEEYKRIQNIITDIENYLEAAKPVLESKFLMKKLEESSLKDGLTDLYNRRFLEGFLDKFEKQADREKKSYAIMMIDIDFFKNVNDTYGHDVGDVVIKELANTLKSNIRSSDIAIRYGGEEFLVLLYNPDRSKVISIANKIANRFKNIEFHAGDKSFKKTLSIGISYYPEQADSIWQAIKFADIALYVAKESGRNRIVEFTPDMSNEKK